jgi:uncharacterized membrane protein
MSGFTISLAAFVLLHVGVSASGLRGALVRRLGEGPYRGLFSLASALALGAMIWTFRAMLLDPNDPLHRLVYEPPAWGRHAAQGLVFIAFLFVVSGLLTPGPTLVGAEALLDRPEPARGVLRITRHPFLWGVAFWAAGHLLANGERYALMLFGAIGVMALLGARSIDRKGRARSGEAWDKFAAVTSNAPFVAIAQGRNRLALEEMWWRLLVGVGAYLAAGWLHGVIGPRVFP